MENYFSIEKLKKRLIENEENVKRSKRVDRSSLPLLIELSIHSDEIYSFKSIESLLKSIDNLCLNVFDSFHSNLLMYIIRYQRYRLFELILNEYSNQIDFRWKDQQGNTIVHYAVIYFHDDLKLFQCLIDKFNENHLEIDERNLFGMTPLILAMFSHRFDIVLLLLDQTRSSPFVRDISSKRNLFDYFPIRSTTKSIDRSLARFHLELHQTIPSRFKKHFGLLEKNFFEYLYSRLILDQSDSLRLIFCQIFQNEFSSKQIDELLSYLHHRYPSISFFDNKSSIHLSSYHRTKPNSKEKLHQLFTFYEEKPRRKALPPILSFHSSSANTNRKIPSTLRTVSVRLSMISLLTRSSTGLKITNEEK